MICKACNKTSNPQEIEDCFERALDVLKSHYIFYKNALQQRDLELQQVKERNDKLSKALQLLQKNQQPTKRFKSQHHNDSWLKNNSVNYDISLIDDEPIGATNLNVALNSEQLFDTSALSPAKNEINISSSESVVSPRIKESPKRNKQRDLMRCLKDRNSKRLERSKSDWRSKDRNSPSEKSWVTKFLNPATAKTSELKNIEDVKKIDKRLCLSLKKSNSSKLKQSLIQFNKSKDDISSKEEVISDTGEDVIDASPVVNKNLKAGRSWAQRLQKRPQLQLQQQQQQQQYNKLHKSIRKRNCEER